MAVIDRNTEKEAAIQTEQLQYRQKELLLSIKINLSMLPISEMKSSISLLMKYFAENEYWVIARLYSNG